MHSRSLLSVVFFLLSCLPLCLAWTAEDHEIFRLRDEVLEAEGPDVTFYDILGISSSASQNEVKTALRKKSLKLHPDKAIPSMIAQRSAPKRTGKPGDKLRGKPTVHVQKGPSEKERAQITKEANERYARLRVIASVLSGGARERYDHFLQNGFPMWRGTGYYYARFRPGLGSVMMGLLIVFGGFAHYGAMYISYKRQRDFVQRYVSYARKMAWGNESGVPGLEGLSRTATPPPPQQEEEYTGALNRRQKRMQEKESRKKDTGRAAKNARSNGISRPVDAEPMTGPQGSRKKVIAENGKVLIVDSIGDVFLEETTEEGEKHEYLLDPEEIPRPTFRQTALFRLPVFIFNQSIGRGIDMVRGTSEMKEEGFLDQDGMDLTTKVNLDEDGQGAIDTATAASPHDEIKKRKSRSKR